MKFLDYEICDYETFNKWYDYVINLFSDENHCIQTIKPNIVGDEVILDIIVTCKQVGGKCPLLN